MNRQFGGVYRASVAAAGVLAASSMTRAAIRPIDFETEFDIDLPASVVGAESAVVHEASVAPQEAAPAAAVPAAAGWQQEISRYLDKLLDRPAEQLARNSPDVRDEESFDVDEFEAAAPEASDVPATPEKTEPAAAALDESAFFADAPAATTRRQDFFGEWLEDRVLGIREALPASATTQPTLSENGPEGHALIGTEDVLAD